MYVSTRPAVIDGIKKLKYNILIWLIFILFEISFLLKNLNTVLTKIHFIIFGSMFGVGFLNKKNDFPQTNIPI